MPSAKELAKALARQDSVTQQPRNRFLGAIADAAGYVSDQADRYVVPERDPLFGGMRGGDLLPLRNVNRLLDDLSYGGRITTGRGQTTTLRPEVVDTVGLGGAMMPAAKSLGKAALREGARQIETGTGIGRAVVDPRSPITTWHGSPHTFPPTANNPLGEFDPMKVGTGEGAQAYGVGAGYLAEAKGLAEGYRNALGHKGALDLEYESGKRGIPLSRESRIEFMRQAQPNVSPEKAAKSFQYANSESRNLDQAKLAELFKDYKESKQGNLYKVDLPDEHVAKMLNWDKPLSEQHPDVQRAFNYQAAEMPSFTVSETGHPNPQYKYSAGGFPAAPTPEAALKQAVDSVNSSEWMTGVSGEKAYRAMAEKIGATAASKKLAQSGVPGIRYLDAASRDAAGKGTSNFVVFDPKHMNILERNGVGGAMIPRPKTEFEILHDTAQRNAALPVEQGGLGLPANNTYIDRANAMGKKDVFHGSKQDITGGFNPGYDDNLAFVTESPEFASKWIGKGKLQQRSGEQAKQEIKSAEDMYREIKSKNMYSDDALLKLEGDAFNKEYDLRNAAAKAEQFKEFGGAMIPDRIHSTVYPMKVDANKTFNPETDMNVMSDFFEKNNIPPEVQDLYTSGNYMMYETKPVVNYLKDKGYDSMRLRESTGDNYPTIAAFNPSQVRSRFAAFDPMRRHEADILAGVGVGGMLDPQAIAEALRQQDRK